jgi:BirA family biotin operon repressor/biotin-[acetyl-CoA-carboxylase] ligase
LLPLLQTRWLARPYRWLERTDSTNRDAAEWAAEGAPHGATVVAEAQNAGRGRLGRSFFSPPYRNLYTSIVLRGALQPSVVFAAAVAVARSAAEVLEDSDAVQIKWPNDVLVGELKTAGILVESSGSVESRVAVLGIGVNLNIAREEFPMEFRDRATSLAAFGGREIDRAGFTARLYGTLEGTLERHERGGFEAIRGDFEAFFRMTGQRVRVHEVAPDPPDGTAQGEGTEGRVVGVASDGALRIARDDGSEERVLAGDVTIAKERPE